MVSLKLVSNISVFSDNYLLNMQLLTFFIVIHVCEVSVGEKT